MDVGGRYIERLWPGDPAGQTRADRQPIRYRAFLPKEIADFDPLIPPGLSKLLSEADTAVIQLNSSGPGVAAQLEVYARQLLRQESLASSRIEGLALSQRRLGRAAFAPEGVNDRAAREVLANVASMREAISIGSRPGPFSLEDLLHVHQVLMGDIAPRIAGKIRKEQNWVGSGWNNPSGADFVPPPPAEVEDLLEDLVAFVNLDDLPVTLHAAIAHAQFETVHPFADGNGRVGRCLIHIVNRRHGIAPQCVPPISLEMAADVDRYVRALTSFRERDSSSWVSYFAQSTIGAVSRARTLIAATTRLQERWQEQVIPRRGSTAERLIEYLPANPVIDVKLAADLAGTSNEAARLALKSLEEAGVLAQITRSGWGRVWEAPEIWTLLEAVERGETPTAGTEDPAV